MNLAEHAIHAVTKRLKKLVYGKVPGIAGSFPYFGVRVYFPRNSVVFQRACDERIYERDLVRILTTLALPGTYYFDIGANIGLMSIPVLRACSSCRVVSFEPSPSAIASLQRTVRESDFNDRWTVIPKASGDQSGFLEFCVFDYGSGAYDGFRDTKRAGTSRRIDVPVTTVDEEWMALGRPKVSVFKVDVEGAELLVLKGAMHCIAQHCPTIAIEWNAKNLASYECPAESILEWSAAARYQIFAVPHLSPITDAKVLRLHMLQTDNFLLAPEQFDVQELTSVFQA